MMSQNDVLDMSQAPVLTSCYFGSNALEHLYIYYYAEAAKYTYTYTYTHLYYTLEYISMQKLQFLCVQITFNTDCL